MALCFTVQSTLHVGVIMDGNGRWAVARGLPRAAGHRAGVQTVGRVVKAAPQAGIGILTLFAFSSDNWRRPPAEVETLMRLLSLYMAKETQRCVDQGVRLDRLSPSLCAAISRVEAATARGARLWLRIAVDYSARDAILAAARGVAELSLDALGT